MLVYKLQSLASGKIKRPKGLRRYKELNSYSGIQKKK